MDVHSPWRFLLTTHEQTHKFVLVYYCSRLHNLRFGSEIPLFQSPLPWITLYFLYWFYASVKQKQLCSSAVLCAGIYLWGRCFVALVTPINQGIEPVCYPFFSDVEWVYYVFFVEEFNIMMINHGSFKSWVVNWCWIHWGVMRIIHGELPFMMIIDCHWWCFELVDSGERLMLMVLVSQSQSTITQVIGHRPVS